MERVTQKNERGYYLLGDGIYSDWGVPEQFRGDDVDRLAAYEDTGLEPEEIKNALGVPMTNADRIRAMSDKELAKFLYDFFWGRKEQVRLFNLEKWLQQPAEEEEHDRRTEIKH